MKGTVPVPDKTVDELPELLSVSQAAKYCGLSKKVILKLVSSKQIPAVRQAGETRFRIRTKDMMDFIMRKGGGG